MTAYQQAHYVAMKRQIVKDFRNKLLSQKDAIRILQMSSVGFWKLCKNYDKYGDIALTGLKRGPKPWNRPSNRTSPETERLVGELLIKYPYLGSRRLAQALEDDYGIRLHRNTVLRILHRKQLIPPKPEKPDKDPILYTKDAPGQEVQIDTAFPEGKHGKVEFAAIDDFCRWTAVKVGTRATEAQSIKFLHYIVRISPFHIAAVRTDNGFEFKKAFSRACDRLGIRHIRNPTYSPEKNGKVERLHRTLHEECYWRYGLLGKPLQEVNYRIQQYLSFYNYRRRHSGMGMNNQSPFTKLSSYLNHLPLIQPADINLTVVQYTI
jgi:transposase InsO family protein